VFQFRVRLFFNTCLVLICSSALAAISGKIDPIDSLGEKIKQEISKQYPGSRIELTSEFHWIRGGLSSQITKVEIVAENKRGEVQFIARDGQNVSEAWISFAAWAPTWIAKRRIMPGERLHSEMFIVQDVNVAVGMAREYRGIILSHDTDVSGYEASQTILEGQFPMTSGVRRVPDLRRGEAIQIRMVSGGVTLSTSGVAEEPSYVNQSVRVMASKTKRSMTGRLLPEGVVEVRL
jgi:flagella basal body P-ring formation protein FlgA